MEIVTYLLSIGTPLLLLALVTVRVVRTRRRRRRHEEARRERLRGFRAGDGDERGGAGDLGDADRGDANSRAAQNPRDHS